MIEIEIDQGSTSACSCEKMTNFMIRGRQLTPNECFRSIFAVLTHIVETRHGSKNLLQRGILYRHEKILLRQGRQQAIYEENYV